MSRGAQFPDDQAEVVFLDLFVEQLEALAPGERLKVLADVIALCRNHPGKHPLSAPLSGWNTLAVLAGHRRVVYRGSITGGVGTIEVLCLGPRRDSEVYDLAAALTESGRLTNAEVTQLWVALALIDVVAESVGLDGWDYRPAPAPQGMRRAAVAAGLLEERFAELLSLEEVQAAMEHGWSPTGPDPAAAVRAALDRARGGVDFAGLDVLALRAEDRCDVVMPRARFRCVRKRGHPGPHRSS